MPAASSVSGPDIVPIVQSGTNKKASFTIQKALWDSYYQPINADLTAIAALTGTNNIYYRSGASTWPSVTIGSGISFSSGALSIDQSFAPFWTGQHTFAEARTVASSASATLDDVNLSAQTTSVTGATHITTAAGFNKVSLYTPTYDDSSAVTIDQAATLYIANAPQPHGLVTITKAYALWANNGLTRFDGGIVFGSAAPASGKFPQSDATKYTDSGYTLPTAVGTKGVNLRWDGVNVVSVAVPYGAVTSTVDQTAATETAHVVYTVPANSAAVGTTYRITAWGDIDNGTTGITFTPTIRWGGTAGVSLLATPTVVGTTTAQTNKKWRAVAEITIRTTGASGTAMCSLDLTNHTASSSGAFGEDQDDTTATVTIDTTANKDLDLTWTLSATTGTPHIRTYGGFIEIIN